MEIKIVGSDEPGVHVGKLGRLLLALSRGEKIELVPKLPGAIDLEEEARRNLAGAANPEAEAKLGPTVWKFGRGIVSQDLCVTASCAHCKQTFAFYSLNALAGGFQHCAKVEHAPVDFAAQWEKQDAWDRKEQIEREEQLVQREQDDAKARVRFIKEQ